MLRVATVILLILFAIILVEECRLLAIRGNYVVFGLFPSNPDVVFFGGSGLLLALLFLLQALRSRRQ